MPTVRAGKWGGTRAAKGCDVLRIRLLAVLAVLATAFGVAAVPPAGATVGATAVAAMPRAVAGDPVPPAVQEAAQEATGRLRVTPTTDLLDGQAVTLRGRGFGPVVFLEANECRTRRTDTSLACGNEFRGLIIFTADGAFDVDVAALAALDLPEGRYDCRPGPGRCELRLRSGRVRMNVPLTFQPDAPLAAAPTVTMTPASDLVDGQLVDVHAAGFLPGEWVDLTVCPEGARELFACVGAGSGPTDDAGTLDARVALDATPATYEQATDCRRAPCELVASTGILFGRLAGRTPLPFDPAAPLRPPPTLTVTPSTDLHGGQVVQVHGEGFLPLNRVDLFECKARAVSALSCGIFRDGPRADATAAEDGSFDVEFQIRPRFRWLPGPARDCHVSRCGIGAYDGDGPLDVADEPLSAITPITFAPRA